MCWGSRRSVSDCDDLGPCDRLAPQAAPSEATCSGRSSVSSPPGGRQCPLLAPLEIGHSQVSALDRSLIPSSGSDAADSALPVCQSLPSSLQIKALSTEFCRDVLPLIASFRRLLRRGHGGTAYCLSSVWLQPFCPAETLCNFS